MRKLTSILLVICLLMAMMPQIAAAEGDACEMGGSTYSSVKEAFDEALKAKPTTETAANPTVIRLLKDTVETEEILIDDEENERFFALDLNDHVLTVDIEGLAIKSSENLTITDSASQKTERYFTDERRLNGTTWEDGQDGAYETWTTEKPSNLSGVIVTSGGVIARGKDKVGQGINVTGGLLTISGGTVIGQCLYKSGSGGCAVICDSIIMTGGRITGNSGWSMTALASMRWDGDVLLLGGSIDHNTASVYAGGTSTFGARSFTIGGDVKIENNTAAMFGDNLLITGEKSSAIVLLSFATGENAPKKGMSVVVSKLDPDTGELCRGQISYAENCLEAYANYLISDNDADEVKFVTDHLELAEKSADSDSIARVDSGYIKTLAEVQAWINMTANMIPITVTLLKDVTGTLTIPEGAEVTLDMNGCVFHDGRAEGAEEAVISNKGTLHIVGSSSPVSYTFTENSSGCWIYDEAGTARTVSSGGLIAGNGTQNTYGAINNEGTLTVTDVALTGFNSMVGVFTNQSMGEGTPKLTVTGCIVAGNTGMLPGVIWNLGNAEFSSSVLQNNYGSMMGGAIYNAEEGVLSISGCSIMNNSSDSAGGAIYNAGTLTVSGGTTITGNTSPAGGGLMNTGALTLTGDVVIYDNTDGDTQNNLWTAVPVTISDDSHTGMKIGIMRISGESGKTISGHVTGSCAESDLDYFYADDTNYSLSFDPTAEVLVITGNDVCSIGSTGYKSIAEALAAEAPEGESTDIPTVITLLGNVRESVTIPEGRYIELDLNGKVLKSDLNGTAVTVNSGAELKLTDTCTPSENPHYFVYRKHTYWEYTEKQTGTVSLSDITDSTPDNTIVVLYGGCITGKSGGTITSAGIYNSGTMTITGGSIAGLTSILCEGAAVYNSGTMTITGGSIVGNASNYAGGMRNEGALTVGGAARILHNSDGTSKANLLTCSPVAVAAGEKTGSIGVQLCDSVLNPISGAFTGECLESDLSFFFPDNENFELSYDSSESVLKLTALDVCSSGGVGYPSVAAALAEKPGEESSLDPTVIKLLRNTRENVTIPKDRCITLDLNGKVMQSESLSSSAYVITVMGDPESGEDGVLTICDTDTSGAGNFFVYKSSGSWIYTDENTGAIGIDEITDETPDGTIIKVPGGCITGRSGVIEVLSAYSLNISQGVYNKGRLFFEGGTIAGTGGALYNEGTFVMKGGNIIGNCSSEVIGSGITNAGEATLAGGRISFNNAAVGCIAAVFNRRDALFMTVGGTLRVEKNPGGNLATEIPIYVGGGWSAPAAGMSVGIGLVIDGGVSVSAISGRLTENSAASDLEYFFPDHSDYELYFQNDHFAYKVKDISKFTVGEVYQGKALSTVVDGTSVEIQGDIYTNGSSPYGRKILFADLQENAAVYGFTKVTVRSQMGATQAAGNTNDGTVSLIDGDGEVLFEAAALGGQFRYDKKVSGGAIIGSWETSGFAKTDEKAKAIDYVDLRLQYQIRLPEGSSLKDKDVKWGWTVKFGEKELDVPGANFMTSEEENECNDTFTSNVVITNIPLLDYAELEFSSAMYVEFVQDGVTYRIEQPVDNSAAMLTRNIKGMVEAYYSQLDSLDTDQQTYVTALYNLLNPEE